LNSHIDENSDQIGAYVLDALSPEERVTFEEHLIGCAACQAEVVELHQVVDLLPLAVDIVEPPASLRDRILAEAREDTQEPPRLTALPGGAPSRDRMKAQRTWIRAPQTWLALAASVVIVALGGWNLQLRQNSNGHQTAFEHDMVVALASGARVSTVAGTTAAPTASAALVQPRRGHAYFVVQGLPPTPSNKVYEIWLMRHNVPHRAAVFSYSGNDAQIVSLPVSSTGYALTAVTDEPGQGGPVPTGRQVLVGRLSA
jgi:anti-sigma factor RsiW